MAINDHPVEHQTSNFILFKAKRADLVGGVDVTITDLCKSLQPEDMSIELMKATTEFCIMALSLYLGTAERIFWL